MEVCSNAKELTSKPRTCKIVLSGMETIRGATRLTTCSSERPVSKGDEKASLPNTLFAKED